MRAWLTDGPHGLDSLTLRDVPPPKPGPGEIRLGVKAVGVNFADSLLLKGQYQMKPPPPFGPGLEVAGKVLELGPGTGGFSIGQRVLALTKGSGYADEVVVRASACYPLTPSMDMVTAAGFAIAYGTSDIALARRAGLKPGETLLVHGASGGVGLTAVELGAAMGATVIACASSDEKLRVAQEYGAKHLINSKTGDIRAQVLEITGGRGADVIYDPVGGEAFDISLRCVNFEGRILVIGFAGGTVPQIPANILLVKTVSAIGLNWGSYADREPEAVHESFGRLGALYEQGLLKPHVSDVFPLEDAKAALAKVINREAIGKVVIEVH